MPLPSRPGEQPGPNIVHISLLLRAGTARSGTARTVGPTVGRIEGADRRRLGSQVCPSSRCRRQESDILRLVAAVSGGGSREWT